MISAVLFFQMLLAKCSAKNFSGLPVASASILGKSAPRTCLRNVTKYLAPGAIVVFHDSEKAFRNMRYALPRTLEKIRQMGLRCKAIEL